MSRDDIQVVEQRLGRALPPQYVEFLLRNNGGTPEPDAFDGFRPDEGGLVHFFHSVDGGRYDDLLKRADFYHEAHDVPGDLLPVASTQVGNLVCIALDAAHFGEMYFWSHDAADRGRSTWKLAPDLNAFLATFHKPTRSPAPTAAAVHQELQLVGKYREFGYEDAPSLASVRGTGHLANRDKVVAYLSAGKLLMMSPGRERDIFDQSSAGSLSILTDGKYAWHQAFVHYVRKHDIPLPPEFLAHIEANGFAVPATVDTKKAKLPDRL